MVPQKQVSEGLWYVAGCWRTPDEAHTMARNSVVETLKLYGRLSRESLIRKTGLAELNVQRALSLLMREGAVSVVNGRYYAREACSG